jgi:hypothetical protein
MSPGRSYEPITRDDLVRLADIARADREDRFERKPRWRYLYADRILAVALCQGAALHFVNGRNGVKDFDVWTFYSASLEAPFPARWRTVRDFGSPKFGQTADHPNYVGRRVDLIGRSVDASRHDDPVMAVRRYLSAGRTESARLLAAKAVVLLEPSRWLGEIVWPLGVFRASSEVTK